MLASVHRATVKVRDQLLTVRLRRTAVRRLRRFRRPHKLHLGCGSVRLPGWINIDLNGNSDAVDLCWDLTKRFPLADGTCSHIYNEHVLEHFDVECGVSILRECHRLLQAGGVLRVAMPSLKHLVAAYESGNWRNQDWLRTPEFQFIETPAEMLNISFRWWGHRWIYDIDELRRRLLDAGFARIAEAPWGESRDDSLRSLETRTDSKLICEARK